MQCWVCTRVRPRCTFQKLPQNFAICHPQDMISLPVGTTKLHQKLPGPPWEATLAKVLRRSFSINRVGWSLICLECIGQWGHKSTGPSSRESQDVGGGFHKVDAVLYHSQACMHFAKIPWELHSLAPPSRRTPLHGLEGLHSKACTRLLQDAALIKVYKTIFHR